MKLVLPGDDPELDGAASAFAYGQFLKETTEERATGAAFGEPDETTREILEEMDEELSDASYYLYNADSIVMVGAADVNDLSPRIMAADVEEVVFAADSEPEGLPEAEIHVEDVAATATVVADRFREEDVDPGENEAVILQLAILQATDGLESDETTERDEDAFEWLSGFAEVNEELLELVGQGESD